MISREEVKKEIFNKLPKEWVVVGTSRRGRLPKCIAEETAKKLAIYFYSLQIQQQSEQETMGEYVKICSCKPLYGKLPKTYDGFCDCCRLPRVPVKGIKLPRSGREARCGICGGSMVFIRGRHPDHDRREVCPTCCQERLEQIRDISDRDYGKSYTTKQALTEGKEE